MLKSHSPATGCLMMADIACRFGISEAGVSHIWATWLRFSYHRLRELPIWATHVNTYQKYAPSFQRYIPKRTCNN